MKNLEVTKMNIKALIVDDEYPARQEMRFHLGKHKEVQVVGEASSVCEARELIEALDYDVIFLDIKMPNMTGIDLAKLIEKKQAKPQVVFVTAYNEFAVAAFDVAAADYVLKPIEEDRLSKTIERLKESMGERETAGGRENAKDKKGDYLLRIPGQQNDLTVPINVEQVCFVFTELNNVFIKTVREQLLTRYTLKELEIRLSPQLFTRIHRCYLVNVNKIKWVAPYFNGTYTLVMDDQQKSQLQVSRKYVKNMKRILGML
jgi:DNA-binding LytR/AlgR family response regulator